jgi:hypothetical protein
MLSAHVAQNVHSYEQVFAVALGGSRVLQRSQRSFIALTGLSLSGTSQLAACFRDGNFRSVCPLATASNVYLAQNTY